MIEKETAAAQLEKTKKGKNKVAAHHSVGGEGDLNDVRNLAAIRKLLFGKQASQINHRITELEGRVTKTIRGQARRITVLEKKEDAGEDLGQLARRIEKLEGQLLQSIKLLQAELKKSENRIELKVYTGVRDISAATLEELTKLRDELRGEMKSLQDSVKKNSQFGEVLVNLGKQLQGDPSLERTETDDEPS